MRAKLFLLAVVSAASLVSFSTLAGVTAAGATGDTGSTAGASGDTGSAAGASNPVPVIGLRHSTSQNWAGYAAYNATFSSVNASWSQPSVSCGSSNTYSAYWVGLDGYNDSTVEQTGTEADCASGSPSYYAWWEMYPHRSYQIRMTVAPGDVFVASVTFAGLGQFTLNLKDTTTGKSFSTTQKLNQAKRASAEVIVEAPYSGGILPLANFGTASFTSATANSNAFGSLSPLDPMTMNDPNGGKATPSNFDSTNTQFSVTYSP